MPKPHKDGLIPVFGGDDGTVPLERGKRLAGNLATEGRILDVRSDKKGYGLFTNLTPECGMGKMLHQLLDMIYS